jgi:hypothetical protein
VSERIGYVEILRTRVYPLDAALGYDSAATTVVVAPGVYPLWRDGISHFWMMTGHVNSGRMHRLGDGIFSMMSADEAGGPEVTFPSKVFGPDEWADFLAEPTCTEGHPEQRLRVRQHEDAET